MDRTAVAIISAMISYFRNTQPHKLICKSWRINLTANVELHRKSTVSKPSTLYFFAIVCSVQLVSKLCHFECILTLLELWNNAFGHRHSNNKGGTPLPYLPKLLKFPNTINSYDTRRSHDAFTRCVIGRTCTVSKQAVATRIRRRLLVSDRRWIKNLPSAIGSRLVWKCENPRKGLYA